MSRASFLLEFCLQRGPTDHLQTLTGRGAQVYRNQKNIEGEKTIKVNGLLGVFNYLVQRAGIRVIFSYYN